MKIINGLVGGLVVLLTIFFTNVRRGVAFALVVLTVYLLAPYKAQANPRQPLPQVPELVWPLYHETFDEVYDVYSYAVTNGQVTLGNFTFNESWSGYALQRSGAAVTPFFVPAVDSGQTNINCNQGTIRVWFVPTTWSSATQTNGAGPGGVATLLELDAVGKKECANVWSLQISADGTALSLVAQSDDNPALLLQTDISWQANQSHLISLDYGLKETALLIDGQLVAQGAGTLSVPPQLAGLFVGSSLAGKSIAGGDFDELFCFEAPPITRFYHQLTTMDLLFYYNVYAPNAALGPISAEEIAAREKRIAERKAQRAEELGALSLDDGGMEAMAARGTYGPLDASACVTNVPVYMTNVYAGFETDGTMTVTFDVVGGTNADGLIYDVLGTTNLASGQWFWVTNTPTCNTVVIMDQEVTQTFYVLRSTQDSDGSGMPDWWQMQYFGHIGVDPYADPDGDGWNNLQEFQNGTNPNQFNTPPAPRILSAILDSAGTHITLTWQSGGGTVSNFGIEDSYVGEVTTVSATTFTSTIPVPDDSDGNIYNFLGGEVYPEPVLQVRSYFPNGSNVDSDPFTVSNPNLALDVQIVRGPMGQPYLVVASPPANLSFIRMLWTKHNPSTQNDDFQAPVDLPASNLVNGIMRIPLNTWQSYLNDGGSWIRLKAFTTNGAFGDYLQALGDQTANEELWPHPFYNFVDARSNLTANLKFLLRAATMSNSFSYAPDSYGLPYQPDGPMYQPESSYARSASPASYEYSGFHTFSPHLNYSFLQEDRPVQDNFQWRNCVFNTNDLNPNGVFDTGVYGDLYYGEAFRAFYSPTYHYTGSGTEIPLPLAFSSANATWIHFALFSTLAANMSELGLYSTGGGSLALANNAYNLYGLQINSAHFLTNNVPYCTYGTIVSDGVGAPYAADDELFLEAVQPVLSTVGYYFASQTPYFNYIRNYGYTGSPQPLPGSPTFSVNSTSPLLITGLGQQITVSGWAKQQISNGYAGKYAYLEQYFDKAYTIGANGNMTTNSAGILSPYGEFFPTQPGPAALVTMPDIDPPYQRGTGVVQVIKLLLDVNHDGVMDLSFAGPDNTSRANPMKFWVNNDNDGTEVGEDNEINSADRPDYQYGKIRSWRNLEDFARLWVCGLPKLPTASGYTITLSMSALSGNPAINLYAVYGTNNDTGYLSNTNSAAAQFTQVLFGSQVVFDYSQKLKTIDFSQSYTLPVNTDGSAQYTNFLFEGAGIGTGQLTLMIQQGTNTIAQTSAWLDLHDVKDMFEHAHIENAPVSPPSTALTDQSTYEEDNFVPVATSDGKNLIVFVHGWRLPTWTAENFSQTMFKRLWWQGYQGRFATLRWPTLSSETDGPLVQYLTFNRDEYIAFKCAQGTANYFVQLQNRFPDYSINVCAHSHGNVLMMEVLKRHLANGQAPIHNYALLQAAVAAECLDTNAPSFLGFIYDLTPLPDSFYGYAGAIQNAISGHMVNFYNTNDFGVVTCWQPDQILLKPDGRYGYQYLPQGPSQSLIGSSRVVIDPQELMAFLSRPQTQAVGAMPGLAGPLTTSRQVDLKALVGFQGNWDEHSGEFNWNIQRVNAFYKTLGQQLGVIPEQ